MIPVGSLASAAQVLSAYAGPQATPAVVSNGGVSAGAGSFESMVSNATENALNTVRGAEQTVGAGVAGHADVQDVVQALGDAEVTMQTVMAVRDKVLGAYNDIMHMSV